MHISTRRCCCCPKPASEFWLNQTLNSKQQQSPLQMPFFFFVSLFHVLFRDLTYPQDGPVHDWHWNRLLLYAPVHHMMCPGALQALKETIHARFSSFLASCDSANEESRHHRHTVQTFFLSLLCRKISLVRIS